MIVIADDITGAAEMAGIAFARGENVRLVCGCSVCGCGTAANGMVVIATDTRSMSEADAVAEIRRITSNISLQPSALFKKTDSALRGHVVAELSALMDTKTNIRQHPRDLEDGSYPGRRLPHAPVQVHDRHHRVCELMIKSCGIRW